MVSSVSVHSNLGNEVKELEIELVESGRMKMGK